MIYKRSPETEYLPIETDDPYCPQFLQNPASSPISSHHSQNNTPKWAQHLGSIKLYFLPALLFILVMLVFGDATDSQVPSRHGFGDLSGKTEKLLTMSDAQIGDTVVTSSQRKFPKGTQQNSTLQQMYALLKGKTYRNDLRYSTPSANRIATKPPQTAQLKQFAQQANSQLRNPEYPEHLHQIMGYLPYQDLPFCLIVEQTTKTQKPLQQAIAKSIFSLNYTNYITIFIGYQDQGLSYEVLAKLLNDTQFGKERIKRMFHKINYAGPNYVEYKLLMHQLCVQKSVVMFVSSVLNPDALTIMNNYHQLYPVYMTYSETKQFYLPNSFFMRIFDLIGSNDFGSTNRKYFSQSGTQNFLSLALIELCRNFTKKFPLPTIYNQSYIEKIQYWTNAIKKQDNQMYTRHPYQPLARLSQSTEVSTQQQTKILSSLKANAHDYQPIKKTALTSAQMFQALEAQQSVFLPEEYSINRKQYLQNQYNYGAWLKFDKPNLKPLPQRPFCVVLIGNNQTGLSQSATHRYIRSARAVLRQNYTNFHVVYIDDGITAQTQQRIQQSVKEASFPRSKFVYVKNKKSMSPLFNIIRAGFEYCQPEQMQVVVDSDFIIIDINFLNLINKVKGYNPNLWVINTNFKTDKHKFGYSYRLENDNEYRNFEGRTKELRYLSPLPVWEVQLIRSIPLEYHIDKNKKWVKSNWHKALQHSITELATVSHIEYIPQIFFQVSDTYTLQYNNGEKYPQSFTSINSQKILKPLNSLDSRYRNYEREIKQAIHEQNPEGLPFSHFQQFS